MDDNAQDLTVPTTSTVPDPTANADPTNPAAPPQAATRPVQQPDKKQQISVGGHPEQGSISIDPEEDDEEEQQVVKQETQRKETPMVAQTSQPEVVISPEIKEVVAEGEDADTSKLPEEKQELAVALEEVAPVAASVPEEAPLPLPYDQAVQDQKVAGSPKNAKKWWLTEIIREWKKKF